MENRRFLDLTAGIAVNSLGHCDPEITKVISEQSETLIHASNLYHNPWTGALSKLLIDETHTSGAMRDASQVFVCNSGAEANEAAIKFARKVGKTRDATSEKVELVSFQGSFHGRTMGALALTGQPGKADAWAVEDGLIVCKGGGGGTSSEQFSAQAGVLLLLLLGGLRGV